MNILSCSLAFSLILLQITDIFGDDCVCDLIGSVQKTCDSQGNCECKEGFIGKKCQLIDENCDRCYKLVKNKLGNFVGQKPDLQSYLLKYDEFEVAMNKLHNETRQLLLNSHKKKPSQVNNVDELTKNLTRVESKLSGALKYFAQEKSIDFEEMKKEISAIENTLKSFKIPKEDVPILDVNKKITQKLNKIAKNQTVIDKNLKNVGNLLKEIANNNRSLQEKLAEVHEVYNFDLKKVIIDEVKKLGKESMKNKEFAEYLLEKVKKLQIPSLNFTYIDIESVKGKIKELTAGRELNLLDELKEKSKIIEEAFNEFNEIYLFYKNAVDSVQTAADDCENMSKKNQCDYLSDTYLNYVKILGEHNKMKRLMKQIQMEIDELNESIRLFKEFQKILDTFCKDLEKILKRKQEEYDTLLEVIDGQNEDLNKIEEHLDELNKNLKEIEYNDDQLSNCLEDVEEIERYIDDIDLELSKQEESITALEKKLKTLLDSLQIETAKRFELQKIQNQVDKIKIIADGLPDIECPVQQLL